MNRRRPWPNRLFRRLTRRSFTHASDHSGNRTVPQVSLFGSPLMACAILYFLAATVALAYGNLAPAIVLGAGSTSCMLRHLAYSEIFLRSSGSS
jgi:hypothetical protein